MPKHDVRCVHMPYCLLRQTSGGYVIVNRDYKPLGFTSIRFETYSDYPIEVFFKRFTAKTAAKLSPRGDENLERIYLYDDGCIPTASKKNMSDYMERLATLMVLQVTSAPAAVTP